MAKQDKDKQNKDKPDKANVSPGMPTISTTPTTPMSEIDLISPMTRGELIAQEMACTGFVRRADREALSKHYVEFTKTYLDSSGTTGMVTAMVRRDDAGVEPNALEGFVLTIQKQLRAIPEDVHNGSWKFARDDLLNLIEQIGAADESFSDSHVVMTKCEMAGCNVNSPEFFMVGKKKVCRGCFDKASKAGI